MYHLKTDFKGAPPRPFRHINGVYYIRITTHYRDIWRSCKTRTKREAEEYAYKVWYELQNSDAKTILKAPSTLISTEIDAYQKTENYKNLKNSTKGMRLSSARAFLAYCDKAKIKQYDDLTPEFCEAFLDSRGKTGKTFNNVRSDLIKVFAETARRKASKNPFELVPQRLTSRGSGASKPKAAFTDEQVRQIIDYIKTSGMMHADEWLKACRIAMYTGMRYEDIALLRYDEISGDILEIAPKKTETRTAKKIIMRIPPALQRDLMRLDTGKGSRYVLPHLAESYPRYDESGKRVKGVSEPLRPFMEALERLKITPPEGYSIGFHSFRVTLVTKLREAGYSAELISGLVGHTSRTQTEHYNRSAMTIDLSKVAYNL